MTDSKTQDRDLRFMHAESMNAEQKKAGDDLRYQEIKFTEMIHNLTPHNEVANEAMKHVALAGMLARKALFEDKFLPDYLDEDKVVDYSKND